MSGIIPRPFIDELLNRTDIVEFIDSHVSLKKQGSSFVACCPFHNEKSPSFNVVAKKQFYHCFGCGASGNAISFAMDYLHQNFPEAIETLAARIGMQVPREGHPQKYHQSQNLYQLLDKVSKFYQDQLTQNVDGAGRYLQQRGVNDDMVKQFQLGYAPQGWHALVPVFKSNQADLIASGMLIQRDDGQTYDRYRQRIMYPIHDRQGRIIGFGGRATDPAQKPKYLNSPETAIFQKSRELYGLYQVLSANKSINNILVVEGYMDVIALAQFGINNAVATLGTATSGYHIQALSKHTRQLIFCFDGDAAGKQAAWRALESCLPYLNNGLDASFIFLPEGHDPDSLVREEGGERFLERLMSAMPLNQYFFNTLTQSIDTSSLAGKSQLVNLIKPYLIKMSDGPYSQLILDELARRTRIENHRLTQLIFGQSEEKLLEPEKSIHRSPARIAVALLLQNPEIYQQSKQVLTRDLIDGLQQNILKKLLLHIENHPEISTGTLIEVFREEAEFGVLTRLAGWDHQVPEEALVREFLDTILFLIKQEQETKIQQLLKKAREYGLAADERVQLQGMLRQRHQYRTIDNGTAVE